jgi:hypothetical protein
MVNGERQWSKDLYQRYMGVVNSQENNVNNLPDVD